MPTALISVSDKTGVVNFAKKLKSLKWDIISSDGTSRILRENYIECNEVSEITKFPEILDGRVKTLNPKIYGGILAIRNNVKHIEQLNFHNINTIEMVVVNLYPFESISNKILKPKNKDISDDVISNIDIGGVSLLRAAAKNYKNVIVICDLNDYELIIENLKNNLITNELRLSLSAKAFQHTAYYDSLISNYLTYEKFPVHVTIPLKKNTELRYGENHHQRASLYFNCIEKMPSSIVFAKQLHGKELSYNNYLDLDTSWRLVHEFSNPACVIVKHNNPCGCSESVNIKDAYLKALACDRVSSFGGIISFNRTVCEYTAIEINKLFVECIIAPDYSNEALYILKQKKNLRILIQKTPYNENENLTEYKSISCGMLIQGKDCKLLNEIKFMTNRKPDEKTELEALNFAWKVSKYVKSNAIVLARGTRTVGVGAGQMSRIDSFKIAVEKMRYTENKQDELFPIVLASDAFFPFPDIVEEASKIGITAIIQPGGSIKDCESIKVANEANISMIATNIRHFRH
ncbi:MAG: bifunctional phosphoribosylaminoimidazolecarboxamide formyltransferase/IMP cyclohydrolase [Endomicrobium sp.]|jgi:phosphoribosylaminoimidazolecarboxamide formyltransferase/IMP cyclohydrolase|nr:bifunctional phosphoribosylaminoimidazolecarboxamide formyltransferase/IMP cyclohydrolase [Endomicrobium sp.]